MPNLPVMAELYGTSGRANDSPTARMSLCYDTLNGFIFDPQFDSLDCSERELAIKHLEKVREVIPLEKCVFILDRGYVSMPILNSFISTYKTHFVMRVRRNFNDLVDAVPEPHGETIVDKVIEFPPTKKTGFAMLKVRVIKFLLDSEELETLITNLFDPCKEEFKALYFMRWKVEQENDVIKNKLELENFTGRTENTVLQDVWCAVLLSLICNACKTVMNLKIREQEIQKKASFPESICKQNDSASNRSGKSCQNRHEYKAKTTVIIHEAIPFIAGVIFRPDIHPFDREFELFRVFAGRSKVAYSDGTRTPERRVPRRTHYHHNRKSCTL